VGLGAAGAQKKKPREWSGLLDGEIEGLGVLGARLSKSSTQAIVLTSLGGCPNSDSGLGEHSPANHKTGKGPVSGALLIVDDAPQLAAPVVTVPAVMPARDNGYRRTVVVVVVATLTRITVATTIVRARRAYANAYPAGAPT
jgi:hypothetical protein